MFTGIPGRSLWLFIFVCLCASSAHARILLPDSDHPAFQEDSANENTPHPAFPLFDNSSIEPAPVLRSEMRQPKSDAEWLHLKSKILSDFGSRMTAEFVIPEGLKERAAFWFDIYTRYGEAHRIIHHVLYPWVIYKVVDSTQMLTLGKGPLWLRRERAEKMANQQAKDIRAALNRLAKRKSFTHLSPLEAKLFNALKVIPGSRRKVLRIAAQNVRTQLGQRDFFERGLINSSRYLPYMEEEFKKAGLPTELTRLPFVESSFNEEARSKVGASGIWQIMPRTGKAYMIVTDQIDERNSPLKATVAAAKLLRSYYRAMDTWPLAITSYNNGIGNIQKAIKHAKSRDLPVIIQRYHTGDFRFASSNFFTCFLAALYAEKYNELLFKDVPREPLQEREVIRLVGSTRARYLTKVAGLPQADILRYNLDLRVALKRNSTLPRGFKIHLPPGLKDRFVRQIGTRDLPKRDKGS